MSFERFVLNCMVAQQWIFRDSELEWQLTFDVAISGRGEDIANPPEFLSLDRA